MGVCDSAIEKGQNKYPKISIDDTGISNNQYNSSRSNPIISINEKKKTYILPETIAKRDDVSKYYRLSQKVLGEGATGQVCIGERGGKKYAIKRINKEKLKVIKEIVLEAEISMSIKHPNIMTYYEIYEDLSYISYVMDLGEGGDLFDFIVGCPLGHLPADIAIDLLIQIFSVVDYLHSVKGIVHRDLKPENFMIKIDNDNKPQVKLIDFGMATYIPRNGGKLKEFLGTREYAAPEILEGMGYTEKVDEWALGVIIYNMLTGYEPFKGDSPSEIKDNIRFSDINFDVIEDVDLRELDKQLLNRYIAKRISAKEALNHLVLLKNERDNYFAGKNSLKKMRKTPSTILRKENQEIGTYKTYWNNLSRKVKQQ